MNTRFAGQVRKKQEGKTLELGDSVPTLEGSKNLAQELKLISKLLFTVC